MRLEFQEESDFVKMSPENLWDDIPDFREDFYLQMVLLKQRLLELSPPV